ncbi:MAG: hypothetical protein E7321_04970 [Clostridiales bacterium]|nr:hypothetical protein [Clostridiales bacterium]
MKRLYFSTFVQGLEKPVEAMLRKEGGVAVERIVPGAALYRSVREPAMPFVHQTFSVLFQMKPVSDVNDAIKRLMATGSWLDRFPYEETEGKRFRIVTVMGDKLVSANMRYVDMLEKAICENTGMRTYREKPDVELWVLCRPEAAYFLWRMGKQSATRQEGQLRTDVCAVVSFLSQCGAKNAAILGCTNASLPYALKAGGARSLTCVCPDRSSAKLIEGKIRGVRVSEGSSGYTDLADNSQQAVVLHLPVKAEKTVRTEADLRNALFEARRILCEEGRLIVVASLAHAESTLRKTQGVRMLARYDLTLSGQKSAIWVMTTKPSDIAEEG